VNARRRRQQNPEAQLIELYREALKLGRAAGDRRLQRITAATKRDDAYYGAWLAYNALAFERLRK